MSRGSRTALVLLGPFLALFVLIYALPIAYACYQSLTTVRRTGLLGMGGSRTVFAGLDNYAAALGDSGFVGSFGRVLLFGVVQVPVMLALATGLALLLDSASARGIGFFRTAYFLPYGVPGVIASILWGFLYVPGISPLVALFHVDFLSGGSLLWSIANIVTWQFTGYNMLVLVAALRAVPTELYQAAALDGASAGQVVRHVKLPMIRPALSLVTVFSIIGTLQLFSEPLVLAPLAPEVSSSYTPNLSAYNQAFTANDYGRAAAEAVLIALVACVLSFGFLRLVGRGNR